MNRTDTELSIVGNAVNRARYQFSFCPQKPSWKEYCDFFDAVLKTELKRLENND